MNLAPLRSYFTASRAKTAAVRRSFTNELGNAIRVSVQQVTDTGTTSAGTKTTFDAVKITLVGPTSTSDNTITFDEAQNMRECLDEFLSKHKPSHP